MKHLKHLLFLRRLRNSIKYLQSQLHVYESLNDEHFNEGYRREMLNDLYVMKDKYNTQKFKFMRRA